MKAKRVALWGILSAAAIGISALEGLFAFPFLPPGAKPGLSNSVVILAAINSSFAGGIYISVIKSLFAVYTGYCGFYPEPCGRNNFKHRYRTAY